MCWSINFERREGNGIPTVTIMQVPFDVCSALKNAMGRAALLSRWSAAAQRQSKSERAATTRFTIGAHRTLSFACPLRFIQVVY